ncbi:MAG: hypothetical protein R2762_15185 [Bryobacteraceae bacterium]
MVPRGFVDQHELANAIRSVEEALHPDVVLIRYSLGSDWAGDPSIFFRVLLSDEAAKPKRLQKVAQSVAMKLAREVDVESFGLHAYLNFRSKSEQDKLNEPAWA